ncbi:MAG: histidine kinase [Flavobacteriales bacterium]|nr:histidine kinase [Flavobacteriales bacterium]MCB9448618.1 histidine kinase [Flavobacteriales bacterium]
MTALRLQAQELAFKHYDTGEGLPGSEVYDVLEDSQGYMWFATDMGVARYDGYAFEAFTTEDGLSDNTIFEICEDGKGRIWFAGFNQRLCYFERGRIHPFVNNDALIRMINNKSGLILGMVVDANNYIYLGLKSGGYFRITSGGEIISLAPNSSPTRYGWYSVPVENDRITFTIKPSEFARNYRGYVIEGKDTLQLFDDVTKKGEAGLGSGFVLRSLAVNDTLQLAVWGKNLWWITPDTVILKTMEYSALHLQEDSTGNVWVSLIDGGVYRFTPPLSPDHQPDQWLKGVSVTSVTRDRQGGMWFGGMTEGVYYLPTSNMHIMPFYESRNVNTMLFMEAGKDCIYLANILGAVDELSFEGKRVRHYAEREHSDASHVRHTTMDRKGDRFILWEGGMKRIEYVRNGEVRPIPFNRMVRDAVCIGDTIVGVGIRTISCLVGDTQYLNVLPKSYSATMTSVTGMSVGDLYIGTVEGLYRYRSGAFYFLGDTDKRLRARVTAMEIAPDGTIWIATKGAGLLVYKDSVLRQYSEADGLCNNLLTDVTLDDNGDVWVTSFSGASRVRPGNEHPILTLTTASGIASNHVMQVATGGGKVWLLTDKGLSWFSREVVDPETYFAPIRFREVMVNNVPAPDTSHLLLKPGERNIEIRFAALDYQQSGKVRYRYRIAGLEESWSTTTLHSVRYAKLPKGEYTFEVTAANQLGQWNPVPATFEFTIQPYIYETTWFMLLGVALLIGSAVWYGRYRIRQLAWKNAIREEQNNFQMQALIAQMNPHFLYNSLCSIQYFIIRHDIDTSNSFIAHFARLMRLVLENSQKPLIPLEAELEALENYMKLEVLRLPQGFDYSIEVDDDVNTREVKFPSLLLQPFVENAIWHGLIPKSDRGRLSIRITRAGNRLRCEIEDNGVGRQAAATNRETSRPGHESHATKLIDKRLDLLHQMMGEVFHCEYIDLKDADDHPVGTCVVLTFPEIR